MTDYALDYSAGAPAATAVRAAGYSGVARYIGFDPALRPKCITAAEYADMTAHGVGVALVYENVTGDALDGRTAGIVAATRARHWADVIGFPADRPIYMACDIDVVTETQFAAVLDYLRGAGTVLGGPALVGVYGEFDVMERAAAAGVAAWFWQTMAWSRRVVSPRANLLQILGQVTVGGVVCDRSEIHRPDWGQAGTTMEDAMPTAEDLWNAPIDWPGNVTDVAHAKPTYAAREWLTGASINAARAVREAGDAQAAVAGLAKVVAQIGAQVGALTDDEAKILAATGTATTKVLGAVQALLAAEGATEARLVAAIEAVPAAPGGGVDGAAVVAALRDTLIAGTTGPA